VLVDTAGRLAPDEEFLEELRRVSESVDPRYTFPAVDALTGEDAVNVAEAFHAKLELDGVILTKLDGDARGGAALSVKEVVGRPIAFAATGEKVEDFDLFHPDRMASRILGMGDVLTIIEKAEQVYEQEEAEEAAARLLDGQFTLDDFLEQMQQIKKMGPLQNLMGLLPGLPKEMRDVDIDDRELGRVEAIIKSMTRAERTDPRIIDTSRRSRIAKGSGTNPTQVSNLVSQFSEMQKMMKRLGGLGSKKAKKAKKSGKRAKGRGGRVTPKGGQGARPQPGGRVTPKGTRICAS
jgi:signal recognition particle subunit SRP54